MNTTPFLTSIHLPNIPTPPMFTAIICLWLSVILHMDTDITNKVITIIGVLVIRYAEKRLMKQKWFKDIKNTIAPDETCTIEDNKKEEKK
mgnify:CR=1 FL=1